MKKYPEGTIERIKHFGKEKFINYEYGGQIYNTVDEINEALREGRAKKLFK
jgi:hypothetical protein